MHIFPLLLVGVSMGVSAVPSLNPDYLQGTWCLLGVKFGQEFQEENRDWQFEADGRFLHQNSAQSSELTYAGSWKIVGDKLEIKPVYMGGPQRVTLVSEDEFVMRWMGDLVVKRGPCP